MLLRSFCLLGGPHMSGDERRSGGFWTSLPGVLTGLAAVLTAGTGLYLALRQSPQSQSSTRELRPPPARPTPASGPSANSVQPSGFTGPMGPLEHGISYSGGDLYDRPATSPEECAQL